MMIRRRISAVSYLNTIPFIYGIKHAGVDLYADLLLSPPSGTAALLKNRQAEIALVPVAAIPFLDDIEIFSDLCIGASGPVRTVVLMSDTPLGEITKIYLDSHSITSAMLVRVLAAEVWQISPEFHELSNYALLDYPETGAGYLLIGDKVFEHEGKFEYTTDLALEWEKLTSLPFVFAVWAVRKESADRKMLEDLNRALHCGVEHIREAIADSAYAGREYAYEYLTKNIDFVFDEQKQRAMKLFWDKGMKVSPLVNPG